MKKFTKALSIVLALVLSLSVFSLVSFAQDSTLNYLVLGDSIGWGAGISNPGEANYGKIIANTNGYNYTNDAVNGARSADLLNLISNNSRVITDVTEADIISISIGGNDFLRGNLPALIAQVQQGDLTLLSETIANLTANFEKIIARIKELNSDALILVQTLYNPLEGKALGDVYDTAIDMLNAMVLTYLDAHGEDYKVVDVAGAFRGVQGLIAFDNIHPNAQGNVVIAKTVQAKLFELGIADTSDIVIETEGRDWLRTGSDKSIFERILDFFKRVIDFFRNLFKIG